MTATDIGQIERSPSPHPVSTRLAYSIKELAEATSIGRSSLYEEVAAGRLLITKRCGRSIVLIEDAQAWLRAGRGEA